MGALNFYTSWTGITQPISQFDMVAVPGKGGAMENWGLLLFDEDRFLVNQVRLPLRIQAAAKKCANSTWPAAGVVCCQAAHQCSLDAAADWPDLTLKNSLTPRAVPKQRSWRAEHRGRVRHVARSRRGLP